MDFFERKALTLLVLAIVLTAASCQKEKTNFTDSELRHRSDSVVQENTELLRKQFDEDLDRRLSIEVRPLADSFLKKK